MAGWQLIAAACAPSGPMVLSLEIAIALPGQGPAEWAAAEVVAEARAALGLLGGAAGRCGGLPDGGGTHVLWRGPGEWPCVVYTTGKQHPLRAKDPLWALVPCIWRV
eukprot:13592472-Alexandrium_andersonii.AAC.1